MKLVYKRIFVLFSAALNIGFVIMFIAMAYHHSRPFHERSWLQIVDIVERLNLPEAKQNAVLATVKQFRVEFDKHHQDIRQARGNILQALAEKGSVNRDKLHQMIEAASQKEMLKNQAFEAHVLELREQLGNEKGALFFSLLLEHLSAENKTPRP